MDMQHICYKIMVLTFRTMNIQSQHFDASMEMSIVEEEKNHNHVRWDEIIGKRQNRSCILDTQLASWPKYRKKTICI
jgi:hypothetical protein